MAVILLVVPESTVGQLRNELANLGVPGGFGRAVAVRHVVRRVRVLWCEAIELSQRLGLYLRRVILRARVRSILPCADGA